MDFSLILCGEKNFYRTAIILCGEKNFYRTAIFREKAAVFLRELRKVKGNLIDRFAAIPHQLPLFCLFGAFS